LEPTKTGLVLRIDAKVCHVEVEGKSLALPLRGKMFGRDHRDAQPIAVGDFVVVQVAGGGGAIEAVLPRRSELTRSRHGDARQLVVAANISLVLVCAAAAEPPFQPELVDRILAGASRQAITPVLVITKIDRDPRARRRAWSELYRGLGYQVVETSTYPGSVSEESLAELRALLQHNTSVLSGASGVGKSSLINTLDPSLDLRIGTVTRINQGRHTTTHTRLIPLAGGGHVLDTPGVRSFGLFAADPQEIQFLFPEIRSLVGACEYRNCFHTVEPGCAVQAALAAGEINAQRFRSYERLLEEARDAGEHA